MQMLYRLSYVGGGAARGNDVREGQPPPQTPKRAQAPSPKMQRQVSSKAKNPARPSSDSRKVVGDFESSTLADREMAVNKKFATGSRRAGEDLPFGLRSETGYSEGVHQHHVINRSPSLGLNP